MIKKNCKKDSLKFWFFGYNHVHNIWEFSKISTKILWKKSLISNLFKNAPPSPPPSPPLTMLVIWFLFEALQIYLADCKFWWLLCLCVCLFVWWCHSCNFVTEINFINIVKGGGGRGLGLKTFSNQSKTLSDL